MEQIPDYTGRPADGFITTYSGRRFYAADPRAEDIALIDIARGLAYTSRYAGQYRTNRVSDFYSVAEHSWLIAKRYLEEGRPRIARAALMHDASEAYIADVAAPFKPMLIGYRELESGVMAAIGRKFDVSTSEFQQVREYDERILVDEMTQLGLYGHGLGGGRTFEPLGVQLRMWVPQEACLMWLSLYEELFGSGKVV